MAPVSGMTISGTFSHAKLCLASLSIPGLLAKETLTCLSRPLRILVQYLRQYLGTCSLKIPRPSSGGSASASLGVGLGSCIHKLLSILCCKMGITIIPTSQGSCGNKLVPLGRVPGPLVGTQLYVSACHYHCYYSNMRRQSWTGVLKILLVFSKFSVHKNHLMVYKCRCRPSPRGFWFNKADT